MTPHRQPHTPWEPEQLYQKAYCHTNGAYDVPEGFLTIIIDGPNWIEVYGPDNTKHAKQVCLSVNNHAALVEALEYIRNGLVVADKFPLNHSWIVKIDAALKSVGEA